MTDLLLTNVRPDAKESSDILIRDGRIAAVGKNLPRDPGVPVHEGGNAIAIAPFIEAHVHLDKILWGLPWHSINVPPSLRAMIDNEVDIRRNLPWSVAEGPATLCANASPWARPTSAVMSTYRPTTSWTICTGFWKPGKKQGTPSVSNWLRSRRRA